MGSRPSPRTSRLLSHLRVPLGGGSSLLARRRDALDQRRAVSPLLHGRKSWDRRPGRRYPRPRGRRRGPRDVRGGSRSRRAAPWSRFPPSVTVFGGGLGAAIGTGSDGNANVAHSVEVSESESDLETRPRQQHPVDDGVQRGAGGALQ